MKRNYVFPVLLVFSLVFFAGCKEPAASAEPVASTETKVDMDKVRTEIQALEDAFAAAEKAKDADAVVAYYSDDAVSHNRNAPPSVGKAAIREKIAKELASDTTGNYNVYKIVDLFADGNSATEIGSWTVMNAAGEKKKNGYYMAYFEKRDGKYLCVRDMSVMESAMEAKK